MSPSDDRATTPADRSTRRSGPDALGVAAVVLGLLCAGCLALLLVLEVVGVDPWDGLTVIPWFAFPAAFVLFCAALVRSLLRRRRI